MSVKPNSILCFIGRGLDGNTKTIGESVKFLFKEPSKILIFKNFRFLFFNFNLIIVRRKH